MVPNQRGTFDVLAENRIRQEAMEFAGMGLYCYDFDGIIHQADQGFLSILDLEHRFSSPEEIQGKALADLVHYLEAEGGLRKEIQQYQQVHGREWHIKTLTGKEKYLLEDCYLRRFKGSEEALIQVILRDITQEKDKETALWESEARFFQTLENIDLIAIQLDEQGRIAFSNTFLSRISGWSKEEVQNQSWLDLFVPAAYQKDFAQCFSEPMNTVSELPQFYEGPIRTKYGDERWIIWSNTPHRDQHGHLRCITAIGQDVSVMRRTSEMLKESVEISTGIQRLLTETNTCHSLEAAFPPLLDTAIRLCAMEAGAIYTLEESGAARLRIAHAFSEDFLEEVRELEFAGDRFSAFLYNRESKDIRHEDEALALLYDRHGYTQVLAAPLAASGLSFGALVLLSKKEQGQPKTVLRILHNLALETESLFTRLQAEQALGESEQQYRLTVDSLYDWVHLIDQESKVLLMNQSLVQLNSELGLESRVIGKDLFSVYPFLSERVRQEYLQVFRDNKPVNSQDHLVLGDREFFVETHKIPVEEHGRVTRVLTILHDISETVRSERAMRESEEKYRELFENANDIVYTVDMQGRITSLNREGERLIGCARKTMLGRPLLDFVEPQARAIVEEKMAAVRKGKSTTRYETTLLSSRETLLPVEVSTRLMYKQGKPVGVQGIARDMTERNQAEKERLRLEAQIQHTQKLEGLGVLAGGIAHDFNNLLVGVLGNAGLALTRLPEESPARNYVHRIEKTAQRAAELINQMLAYSGKGAFVQRTMDLSKLTEEMGRLLRASISKKARLRLDCPEGLPLMKGDIAQLHQVLMNLITNASDALNDKEGVITVRTSVIDLDPSDRSKTYLADELSESRYLCLEVADTGMGMDKETQAKIFDPFFSTKFAGRGLGLASVLGIVRSHKGAISVYSEPHYGTRFKVLFPTLEEESIHTQRTLETDTLKAEEKWRGSGAILIADDEKEVLQIAEEILSDLGFSVFTASNGQEALETFKQHEDSIRLVMLDLMMPIMSGQEAFEAIQKHGSTVPIVLSSGYTEEDVSHRFLEAQPIAFIQKPYLPSHLSSLVRRIVES